MFLSQFFLNLHFLNPRKVLLWQFFLLVFSVHTTQAIAQPIIRKNGGIDIDKVYELSQKIVTQANDVGIREQGNYRYIEANGIPDHNSGSFPNRNNPHSISEQNYQFKVPLNPAIADQITELDRSPFGVAINGVVFDPGTAEYWNNNRSSGWRYEALSGVIDLGLDSNHAHVQPNGAYHYHGLPTGLVAQNSGNRLIGYAADGFPIYAQYGYTNSNDSASGFAEMQSSYRLKSGQRSGGPGGKHDGTFVQDYEYVAGAGDLDECNGRWGVTPDYSQGTYHYYITDTFPFIPRCFRGTPDSSFNRSSGGRSPQSQQERPEHHHHDHFPPHHSHPPRWR